jgi:hypothetical protein
VLRALGNRKVITTGLGIIEQTPTRLGNLALLLPHASVSSFRGLLARGRLPHIDDQGLELGPR